MHRHPDEYRRAETYRLRLPGVLLLITIIVMALVAATVWLSTSQDADLDFARGDLGGAVGTTGESEATGVEPIHELETITGANDGHQLVGRRVDIHVAVDRPINDVVFWVGPPDNRLLVVVAHDTRSGSDRQGGERSSSDIDAIRAGQRATIVGTIERVPYAEAMYSWGLTSADRAELMERRVYLSAERVEPNGD